MNLQKNLWLSCLASAAIIVLSASGTASAAQIAYWNFQDDPLQDKTGNGNNLSNSGVSFDDGAAVFDGTHTMFNTTSTLDLTASSAITVEFFMKTSQAGVGMIVEHTANKNGLDGAFASFINSPSAGDATGSYNPNPGNFDIAGTLITDGLFHHYALVIDQTLAAGADTQTEFFVDGILAGSVVTSGDTANFLDQVLFIGSRGNSSLKFVGALDDVRISDGALDPSEFLQVRSVFIPEPSTGLLIGSVLCGVASRRRKRRA